FLRIEAVEMGVELRGGYGERLQFGWVTSLRSARKSRTYQICLGPDESPDAVTIPAKCKGNTLVLALLLSGPSTDVKVNVVLRICDFGRRLPTESLGHVGGVESDLGDRGWLAG